MKAIQYLAAIALTVSGFAYAAEGHKSAHDHKPLHGGIVTEVKDIDLELVAKPELIQLFVRVHGKPVDVSGGTGKLTILAGSEKREIDLVSAGNRMEATGKFAFPAGTKAVAQIQLKGKPTVTARFAIK